MPAVAWDVGVGGCSFLQFRREGGRGRATSPPETGESPKQRKRAVESRIRNPFPAHIRYIVAETAAQK